MPPRSAHPRVVLKVSPDRHVRPATDIFNATCSNLQVLAHDQLTRISLIPGTYTSSRSFLISSLSVTSSINESISFINETLVVSPPTVPVTFDSSDFAGSSSIWTPSSRKVEGWKSVYLPEGWYGTCSSRQILWGTVSDSRQLPSTLLDLSIIRAASCKSRPKSLMQPQKAACSPPCASNGICMGSVINGPKPFCACASGWSGVACDSCALGFWGPSCSGGTPVPRHLNRIDGSQLVRLIARFVTMGYLAAEHVSGRVPLLCNVFAERYAVIRAD